MKKLCVLGSPLVAGLALAGVAQAGCMATVGLSSTPRPGSRREPWVVTIRVLQHGRTPMPDAKPEVRIRKLKGKLIVFKTAKTTRASGRIAPASSSPSPARTPSASTTGFPSRSARWCTPSTTSSSRQTPANAAPPRPGRAAGPGGGEGFCRSGPIATLAP